MKKTIKLSIFIFYLIVLCVFAAADVKTQYTKVGDYNGLYDVGTGYWNGGAAVSSQYTRAGETAGIPLIYDFDNDNHNEIAAFRGNILTIYENKNLDIASGYTFSSLNSMPPLYSFDIDGDSTQEIIIAPGDSKSLIYIFSYNGTLNLEKTINYSNIKYSGIGFDTQNILLGCYDANKCAIFGGTSFRLLTAAFNSSEFIQPSAILLDAASGSVYFPALRALATGDYNGDGSMEYVISMIHDDALDVSKIFWINPDANGSISGYDHVYSYTMVDAMPSSGINYYITPPLLYDFDAGSFGMETAVGFQRGTDNQILMMFNSFGNMLDRYPALTETDGTKVSNVMAMQAKPESGLLDACLLGYDETLSNIMLTCGNPVSGFIIDTRIYTGYTAYMPHLDQSNHTFGIGNRAFNNQLFYSGIDLDEIFVSSGVYSLNWDTCNILGDCTMDYIFSTGTGNMTAIQVDYEKIAQPDIISLTKNNIWYSDDGFMNSKGNISYYSISPCFPSVWKINTSLNIIFTGTDNDGDSVMGTAWLNGFYQQSEWMDSGTSFSFTFKVNQTGIADFGFSVRDSFDNLSNTTFSFTNPVAESGLQEGDCTTTNLFLPSAISSTSASAADTIPADSKIIEGLSNVSNLLGVSLFILFIAIIAIIDIAIFMRMPEHSLGVIAIVDTLLLIIGIKFSIIPLGVVITIAIVGIVVVAIYISSKLVGGKNNG